MLEPQHFANYCKQVRFNIFTLKFTDFELHNNVLLEYKDLRFKTENLPHIVCISQSRL